MVRPGSRKTAITTNHMIPAATYRLALLFSAVLCSGSELLAQTDGQTSSTGIIGENAEYIIIGLLVIIFSILVYGIVTFGDRLIRVSVKEVALEQHKNEEELQSRFTLLPQMAKKDDKPKVTVHKLKKGFDIYIKGKAEQVLSSPERPKTFALKPTDFTGISPIPKVVIEEGTEVKAGDPVFFDKKRPDIIYTAPVSGEFVELRRGDKRAITELVFLADSEVKFKDFGTADPNTMNREEIAKRLIDSGAWPFIKQRPYGIVADPADTPKMVYVSGFNTAPLAPDYDYVLEGQEEAFQAGIDALNKLTDGGVHLGLNAKKKHGKVLSGVQHVTRHYFEGPHPAGNVGVQIHHVNPIGKGEMVWTVKPQDILVIGRLFTEGHFNTERLVAIAGSEIKEPRYVKTYQGASVETFIQKNLEHDHVRVISGDVLTGTRIEKNGYIGYSDELVSVIEEGDKYEAFGWIMPSYPRPTVSPTFLSHFFNGEPLEVNTNTHGERRPFVVTGLYEELLPMDIYPMLLLKAIIVEDFEQMEGLGIYEIDEEDLALCEFACPSKTPIQEIVRKGLDLVRAEG